MRDEWKELIEQEMIKEAERIMEEVNSDPALRDVKAPEEIHDRLFEQIREYERQKVYEQLSEEDRELIRLGKVYKKRLKRRRYLILAAAVLGVLGVGTVCIGEDEDIFRFMSMIFTGGERSTVDSEETELIVYEDEIEAYEKIETEYGFRPVKLEYLPENTVFYKAEFSNDMQGVNIIYEMENGKGIKYVIRPNYRESSFGTVVEDERLQEYKMIVNDVEILLTEYHVVETGENRWMALFVHEEVQYLISVTKMNQGMIENIIKNLGF